MMLNDPPPFDRPTFRRRSSAAARVRTPFASRRDEDVLRVVASSRLARRETSLNAARAQALPSSGAVPPRAQAAITAASSSRWPERSLARRGLLQLAWRNLVAERRTLASRIHRIERRLTVPSASAAALRPGRSLTRSAGASSTSGRGWRGRTTLEDGRVSIAGGSVSRRPSQSRCCRPQRSRLAERWRPSASSSAPTARRSAPRNLTVRWHPDEHWLELRSEGLEHLAIVRWPIPALVPGRLRLPR